MAPALYGLPKIHKEAVPMRPIVDFTRLPLHKLSNYLHKIISPLVDKTETHVQNSYDFIEKVRNTVLHDDEIMVSFDVCTDTLESDPSLPERTPLEAPNLSRLLEFCLSNTYLTFQKKFFKQVHGTAMGASISVTAANLAMESLESRALPSFNPRPRQPVVNRTCATEPPTSVAPPSDHQSTPQDYYPVQTTKENERTTPRTQDLCLTVLPT
ncbi:hypothetical protein HPB52_022354 [Rhipicephalus sanguineus]|uniref:Uncharacterized protein n=1 Tax=Rhipicephalus sanguineus TaxID=34632 RepID=A0A9D4Q9I7_RHISA|nr:hypothetical protein HPB52_022354 [Rhipicephalus sanguineus]